MLGMALVSPPPPVGPIRRYEGVTQAVTDPLVPHPPTVPPAGSHSKGELSWGVIYTGYKINRRITGLLRRVLNVKRFEPEWRD